MPWTHIDYSIEPLTNFCFQDGFIPCVLPELGDASCTSYLGCRNRLSQTERLATMGIFGITFLEAEVRNEGVSGAMLPLPARGAHPSLPLPASGDPSHSLEFLVY